MKVLTDLSDIGTTVGVLVAAGALSAQFRQRKEHLAQQYVNRYWKIYDDGSHGETDCAPVYLRLCEDEFEAVRLGWIDGGTWEVWHRAIRSQISMVEPDATRDHEFVHRCHEDRAEDHRGYECAAMAGVPRTRQALLRYSGWRTSRALGEQR